MISGMVERADAAVALVPTRPGGIYDVAGIDIFSGCAPDGWLEWWRADRDWDAWSLERADEMLGAHGWRRTGEWRACGYVAQDDTMSASIARMPGSAC